MHDFSIEFPTWKCRLDIKFSVQIKLGKLNYRCATWCMNRIYAGNTKTTKTHRWYAKSRITPLSWIPKNRDAYSAKLILAGAKSTRPEPCIAYQKGLERAQSFTRQLFFIFKPCYLLSLPLQRPKSAGKAFKSQNILLPFVRKFHFFSIYRQHPEQTEICQFSHPEYFLASSRCTVGLWEKTILKTTSFSLSLPIFYFSTLPSTHMEWQC